MIRPLACVLVVGSLGCNAVLGLDEGNLGNGGNGGSAGSASPQATGSGTTTGTAASGTTVSGTSQTASSVDASSSATGSACVLSTALQNGEFKMFSQTGPNSWNSAGNLTLDSELQQVDATEGGVRMIATGADELTDYFSIWQMSSFPETYFQCIELRGRSRKTSGSGALHARVTFNGRMLESEMPVEGQMLPFAKACRLPAAIDDYYIQIIADGMPGDAGAPGGEVVEVDDVELNHICCDGVADDCLVAD